MLQSKEKTDYIKWMELSKKYNIYLQNEVEYMYKVNVFSYIPSLHSLK